MEIIFWKVFHNKYLLRKIINHIKNVGENKNSVCIKPCNRMIGFNNLNSLEILVKTRNFQLLMYKLKSNNENVYISKNGILELFQIKVDDMELSNTIKQVIQLLMSEGIRYKFEICNLTEESIKCENEFIFNILISEPYKLQVYQSTLDQCVIKCNPLILKNLITSNNNLSNKFKTYSIRNASTNKLYWKEMMEFILDNEEYYSQRVGDERTNFNDTNKIELKLVLQLNLQCQMKLYELDLITNKNKYYQESFTFKIPSMKQYSFEETVFRLKLFCKFILNLTINGNDGNSSSKNSTSTKIIKLLNEIDVYHTCYSRNKELDRLDELKKLVKVEYLKKTKGQDDGEEIDNNQVNDIQNIQINPFVEFVKNIYSLNLNQMVKEFIQSNEIYLNHSQYLVYLNSSPKIIFDKERNITYYNGDCTINEIISTIELLIEKYSNLPKEKLIPLSESYCTLIGFLFDKLIQFKNVTMNQVMKIHQLSIENSIELKHGFYQIFFYMNIRDSRLTKYLLSNPYATETIPSTNSVNYDCNILINDLKYHFGKYIKPNEFTMDYLFSHVNKCECIGGFQFINSFDEILEKLIQILFYGAINDMKNHNTCFITESLNSILKYLLEIKKYQLFFKHLQFIKDQIDIIDNGLSSQVTTMSTVLTIVSNEYKQHTIPKQLKLIPIELYDLKYSFPKIINSFNYKISTINSICKMDIDNFIRFVEFSNNKYQLKLMFELYNQSLLLSRFDIVKCLLQVYKLPINDINYNSSSRFKNYDCYQESELIIESSSSSTTTTTFDKTKNDPTQFDKSRLQLYISILSNQFLVLLNSFFFNSRNRKYFNKFQKSTESKLEVLKEVFKNLTNENGKFDFQNRSISGFIENGLFDFKITDILNIHQPQQQLGDQIQQQSFFEIYKSNEIQELIDSIFKEYEIKKLDEIKDKSNIFSYSFQIGDIDKCNLILNLFPKTFKITESMIKHAIWNENLHIIKYYYLNVNCNLIDPDLKMYLNNTIINLKNNSTIYQYDNLKWLINK